MWLTIYNVPKKLMSSLQAMVDELSGDIYEPTDVTVTIADVHIKFRRLGDGLLMLHWVNKRKLLFNATNYLPPQNVSKHVTTTH